MSGGEFLLGYSPDGLFELIMRPVRGPVTAFRVRTPPPPPPPPPCGPRSPSPPSRAPPSDKRSSFSIPTSDGNLIEATVAPVYTSLKITVDVASGNRIVREEERPSTKRIPPPRPPPPRTPPSAAAGAPPARPPPPQRRWVSPPPPYPGGLEVREATPPPAYGEVVITKNDDVVEMITRTSQGLYPCFPPTPPAAAAAEAAGAEQAKPSAPPMEEKRGIIRPHSISPFVRNQRPCLDRDLEEVVDFLNFIERKEEKVSPPSTPTAAARPEVPPPMITGRVLNPQVLRPTPVRRRIPPSAALGAPPREESEEEMEEELPDLPCPTPTSDVTVHSTVSSPWVYEDSSEDEEFMEEYEYMDPYEDEGPWSFTPPPACGSPTHDVCVPPAWGERIPGPTIFCKCLLCHEEGRHHPVRCVQCGNAPACCECLWGYMRSRYNSGCPLCRAGDPGDNNPLGVDQVRSTPAPTLGPRTRRALATARNGIVLCGVGRGRGRGRPPQTRTRTQTQPQEMVANGRRGRGRGRRRGVTMEHSSSSSGAER